MRTALSLPKGSDKIVERILANADRCLASGSLISAEWGYKSVGRRIPADRLLAAAVDYRARGSLMTAAWALEAALKSYDAGRAELRHSERAASTEGQDDERDDIVRKLLACGEECLEKGLFLNAKAAFAAAGKRIPIDRLFAAAELYESRGNHMTAQWAYAAAREQQLSG